MEHYNINTLLPPQESSLSYNCLLRHVLRLPQQVPWTGQPRRTTELERLGFYGDTWAALRAGLRNAPRVGPPGRATHRAAGPSNASGRGPSCTPDQLQAETSAQVEGSTWANPGWNGWKAETSAGRARTGRDLDGGRHGKMTLRS
jgi:hypothetical protein